MSILFIEGDEYVSLDFQILRGDGSPEDLGDVVNAKVAFQLRYDDPANPSRDWVVSELDATITDVRRGVLQVTVANPMTGEMTPQPMLHHVIPGQYRVQVRLEYANGALRQVAPAEVAEVRAPFAGEGIRED